MTDHEAIARVEELAGWLGENNEAGLTLAASVTAEHAADLRILLDLAKQVGGLREALQLQSYQMNFLSRMADGQKRCERGKGRATWKTTLDAIRSEALVGEAAARAALRQSKETGE